MMGEIRSDKPYWLKKGTMLTERYRIEQVLEEGGFGIVYLGWDEVLRTHVSIKEYFPRELAGRGRETEEVSIYKGEAEEIFEKGLEKFLDEARVMAAFQHLDGIVWVRDFFYANQTAYIIMEYVDGMNIKEHVEKYGRMDLEKVLGIMQSVLKSLEQIHQKGLIHRDVSPENIVIDKEGNPYLIDFGITRPYTGNDFKTITVFFKRGYAAEEQYREKGKQGPWTDIYGACATMYYMLTGETPEESAQRNIKDTLVPLNAYRDLFLPEHVRRAIKKGMAVDATKRYTTVAQLYQALYEDEYIAVRKRRRILGIVGGFGGILFIIMLLLLTSGKLQEKAGRSDLAASTEKSVSESVTSTANRLKETDEKIDSATSDQTLEISQATPETEKYYIIPDVKGKSVEMAKRLVRRADAGLKITIKRMYHNSVKKGKVIRQSVRADRQYTEGEIKKIVLTVSKGKKPEPTHEPVVTQKPVTAPVQTVKPKEKDDGYAGELPF